MSRFGPKPIGVHEYIESRTCYEALTGCLLWLGPMTDSGYGVVQLRSLGQSRGERVRAHRLVWQMKNGPIPDGLQVRHHCDNRACVNLDHLALGTNDDNVADMVSRGRQAKGEMYRHTKLTKAAVLSIRADSRALKLIADDHGVSIPLISMVKNRKVWAHLP